MTTHIVQIEAKLEWSVRQDQKSGELIAVCNAINLVMTGSDREDLDANIRDTLQSFFRTLVRFGEMEKFLVQHGWKSSKMPSPTDVRVDDIDFQVPFELIAARAGDGQPRAHH